MEHNTQEKLFVKIIPQTGEPRGPIQRNEFKGVWDNAKDKSKESRFVNEKGHLSSYSTKKGEIGKSIQISYIIALIDFVVRDKNME